MHHAPRSLRGRIGSRSDNTCTWAGINERYASDKTGSRRSKIVSYRDHTELLELRLHGTFDVRAFAAQCFETCDKNDVPSADTLRGKMAVRFLDNAAAAVAFHCTAELFGCRDADTTNARAVPETIDNQRRTCTRLAAPIDAAKVCILMNCGNYSGQNNQSLNQ